MYGAVSISTIVILYMCLLFIGRWYEPIYDSICRDVVQVVYCDWSQVSVSVYLGHTMTK